MIRHPGQVVLWMALMGLGSGFPLLFSSQILKTWLVDRQLTIYQVGWVSFLSFPYMLNFLWVPLLDYLSSSGLVSRKAIIVGAYFGCACTLGLMGYLDPKTNYLGLLILGMLLAIFSASQDHLIEAYRLMMLPDNLQALGVTSSMIFFRFSVMLAGGGGLILASFSSWQAVFFLAAGMMLLLAALTYWIPTDHVGQQSLDLRNHLRSCRKLFQGVFFNSRLLLFLLTYRLSVFWLESMLPVFLLQQVGLSVAQVGILYKLHGMFGLIIGGVLMGVLLRHYPLAYLFRMTLGLQVLICLGFYTMMTHSGLNYVSWVVLFECGLQGMLGTLSGVWLIQICDRSLPAFSFSLWHGISATGRIFSGPFAAWVIDRFGWHEFMLVGMCLSGLAVWVAWECFGGLECPAGCAKSG